MSQFDVMTTNVLMGVPCNLPPELPPYTPYSNSIKVPADCCGVLVWQGPKQQEMKRKYPETPIVCAVCVLERIGPDATKYIQSLETIGNN